MTQSSPAPDLSDEILQTAVAEAIAEPEPDSDDTEANLAEVLEAKRAKPHTPRSRQLVTAAAISFSLTLLAGSFAVTGGYIPLRGLSYVARADLGALLMFAPVCALILALLFEVARLVVKAPIEIAEPRLVTLRWHPGDREG